MKIRKKVGKKKPHDLIAKRKGKTKGKKAFKIGHNHRNARAAPVEAEPVMTLQERSLSKVWDNKYDEAWNKYAPVTSS